MKKGFTILLMMASVCLSAQPKKKHRGKIKTVFGYAGARSINQPKVFVDSSGTKSTYYYGTSVADTSTIRSRSRWIENGTIRRHRHWSRYGVLVSETHFDSLDNHHGKQTIYRWDGTLKETGSWNQNCKHGEWLKYDQEGNLYSRTVYDMGCHIENEYWKYQIRMPDHTRKQIAKMNELNGENRFRKRGRTRLMSYEKRFYSSCVIREKRLFDPKGRLIETVTFP